MGRKSSETKSDCRSWRSALLEDNEDDERDCGSRLCCDSCKSVVVDSMSDAFRMTESSMLRSYSLNCKLNESKAFEVEDIVK